MIYKNHKIEKLIQRRRNACLSQYLPTIIETEFYLVSKADTKGRKNIHLTTSQRFNTIEEAKSFIDKDTEESTKGYCPTASTRAWRLE